MTKYTCSHCNPEGIDSPCILEVEGSDDSPAFCPYRCDMDDNAEWKRIAPIQALESEDIIQNYSLQLRMITINSKADVNEAIQKLQDCITDLMSVEWPEDIELKSRFKVTA